MMKRAVSLLSVLISFLGFSVQAQEWPQRPVKFVVAFAPGGANDIVTRLLAQNLTERLKTQFIVENKPGAAGRIAASSVAREVSDGYTFLMGAQGLLVLNHFLYKDVPYKLSDLAGVSLVGTLPYVLVVNPKLGIGSVKELIEEAKRNAGKLNHGSTGSGPILVQQLFKDRAAIEFQNVLYKGTGPALQDLLRGDLHFMFDLIAGNLSQIRAGSVRAIAVSAPSRSSSLPELPTMEEAGLPGFKPTNWYGIVAPAATPRPIIDKLSRELGAIMKDPATRDRLNQLGSEPVSSSPEEFDAFIRAEYAQWEAVARKAGIRPE